MPLLTANQIVQQNASVQPLTPNYGQVGYMANYGAVAERAIGLDNPFPALTEIARGAIEKPISERDTGEMMISFPWQMWDTVFGEEDQKEYSKLLSPEEAWLQYGMKTEVPVREITAKRRAKRQLLRTQLEGVNQAFLQQGGAGRFVANLGMEMSAMAGDITAPILFLPVFGQAGAATRAGRGLIATEQALVKRIPFVNKTGLKQDLFIGGAEGALGNAIFDLPRVTALHYERGNKEMTQFWEELQGSVAMGGVFGATLRSSMGILGRTLSSAAKSKVTTAIVDGTMKDKDPTPEIKAAVDNDLKTNPTETNAYVDKVNKQKVKHADDPEMVRELEFISHFEQAVEAAKGAVAIHMQRIAEIKEMFLRIYKKEASIEDLRRELGLPTLMARKESAVTHAEIGARLRKLGYEITDAEVATFLEKNIPDIRAKGEDYFAVTPREERYVPINKERDSVVPSDVSQRAEKPEPTDKEVLDSNTEATQKNLDEDPEGAAAKEQTAHTRKEIDAENATNKNAVGGEDADLEAPLKRSLESKDTESGEGTSQVHTDLDAAKSSQPAPKGLRGTAKEQHSIWHFYQTMWESLQKALGTFDRVAEKAELQEIGKKLKDLRKKISDLKDRATAPSAKQGRYVESEELGILIDMEKGEMIVPLPEKAAKKKGSLDPARSLEQREKEIWAEIASIKQSDPDSKLEALQKELSQIHQIREEGVGTQGVRVKDLPDSLLQRRKATKKQINDSLPEELRLSEKELKRTKIADIVKRRPKEEGAAKVEDPKAKKELGKLLAEQKELLLRHDTLFKSVNKGKPPILDILDGLLTRTELNVSQRAEDLLKAIFRTNKGFDLEASPVNPIDLDGKTHYKNKVMEDKKLSQIARENGIDVDSSMTFEQLAYILRAKTKDDALSYVDRALRSVDDFLKGEVFQNIAFANGEMANDLVSTISKQLLYLRNKHPVDSEFEKAARNMIKREMNSMQLSSLRQKGRISAWIDKAKRGFKSLLKDLGEFEAEVLIARARDQSYISQVIDQTGLRDLFDKGDQELMNQILLHAKGLSDAIPAEKVIKGADQIGDALKALSDNFFFKMKLLGAKVEYLSDFGGFSQRYDQTAVKAVKRDQWVDQMMKKYADLDKVREAMPWLRTDSQVREYFGRVYDDISTGNFREDQVVNKQLQGGNVNNQVSKRRHIAIRPEHVAEFDAIYGSRQTGSEILNQIGRRAEILKASERFGPNYLKTQDEVVGVLDKAQAKSDLLDGSDARIPEKVRKFFRRGVFAHGARFAAIMNKIIGEADHPSDIKLATWFQSVRQFMDTVSLEFAAITALATDPIQMQSMMMHLGVKSGEATSLISQSIKHQYDLKGQPSAMRIRFQAVGAAMDVFNNASAVRLGGTAGQGGAIRSLEKLHTGLFKYNQLSNVTGNFQYAWMDSLEQVFARAIKNNFEGFDSAQLKNVLDRYGITMKELESLSDEIIVDAMGKERLMLGNLTDRNLSKKFKNMMVDTMNQAVLVPSAQTTSLIHLGTKAGTWEGEFLRTSTQYASFALATYQKTWSRFMNGYGEQGLWRNPITNGGLTTGQYHAIHMMALGIGTATLGVALKDMWKGREPVTLSSDVFLRGNMERVVMQSGFFPILDNFLINPSMDAFLPSGPVVGKLDSLNDFIREPNSFSSASFVLDNIPLIDMAPAMHEFKRALLTTMLYDFYGQAYESRLLWYEEERGQSILPQPIRF